MDKGNYLKYWQLVRQMTIKLLDEFPANSFDYRPAPEIMTVSQMFKHILQVEIYIREGFLTNEWKASEAISSNMFEKELLKDRLRIENEKTVKLLADLPEGRFLKKRETPFGNVTGEILILAAIDEEIHHRGNLYTYLRCLGQTPPQMIQDYMRILEEN